MSEFTDQIMPTDKNSKFIRGSYFFGSASPLNFWDSFREREIEPYFRRFQDDGFNSILLLVPWAQFQPGTSPIVYDTDSFRRLDLIFDTAEKYGLEVILRMGYLWEAKRVADQTYRRFQEYGLSQDMRTAWREFFRDLYDFCAPRNNFKFALMSWEDIYWPVLMADCACSGAARRAHAAANGFKQYLARRFTLAGLNTIYRTEYKSWNELAVPISTDFLYEQYLKYYENEILDPIASVAAEGFPGLRMELRVDPEWINAPDGRKFYHWSMNFPGSSTKVVYYHANIARSHTVEHTAQGAVSHIHDLLVSYCRMYTLDEKKPFIDQFNFFDDTFAQWARIDSNSLPNFIKQCKEVLLKFSSGYALWGYEDWPKDIAYNGSFELGEEGWKVFPGGAAVVSDLSNNRGGHVLTLNQGQGIEQVGSVLSLPADEPRVFAVWGAGVGSGARLRLEINDKAAEVILPSGEETVVTAEFAAVDVSRFAIFVVEGRATMFKVQLYDRYYSQGFRTHLGESRPAVEALRALNHELDSFES
jgi:hypothetical protein